MKIGIMGATGYAGIELVKQLVHHPKIEIVALTTQQYCGMAMEDIDGQLRRKGALERGLRLPLLIDHEAICKVASQLDAVFLALPHGASMGWFKRLRGLNPRLHVIDLSGDYRLGAEVYKEWYGKMHEDAEGLMLMHYGLPSLFRETTHKPHVSNPGCYPTAALLALGPLGTFEGLGACHIEDIIVDAKSGVSGAGRGANVSNLFCEVTETVKPYGAMSHRHTPEIETGLARAWGIKPFPGETGVTLQFTPHLVPMQRGILASCYVNLNKNIKNNLAHQGALTTGALLDHYRDFYKDSPLVRVIEGLPETRWVCQTPYADVTLRYDPRTHRILAFCAIDNTMLGAASQAIQNLNILMNWPQTLGLAT